MSIRIPHNGSPVTTACVGKSADIIPGILRFYVPDGGVILDMNWGKGCFWKKVNPAQYSIFGVDVVIDVAIQMGKAQLLRADNRALPFLGQTFDCCILDPAFGTGSTRPQTIGTARNYNLQPMLNYDVDLIQMYRNGIGEAWRVLKPKGVLIVKCQDVINGGRYQPNHYRIRKEASDQGFDIVMTYILVSSMKPIMRHDFQVNPRSNNSFFLVFRKEST